MAEEIIFSDYQAEVFNEAEMLLRTQGYLGEQLFEDTYVLQKRLADWVIDAVPVVGSESSLMSEATNAYNGVLGIATDEAPAPVVVAAQSEPVKPAPVVESIREVLEIPPRNIIKRPDFGVTRFISPGLPPGGPRPSPFGGYRPPIKPAIATTVAEPAPVRTVRPNLTSIVRGNNGGGGGRGNLGVFSGPVFGGNGLFGGSRGGANPGNAGGIFGGRGGFGNFNPFDRG